MKALTGIVTNPILRLAVGFVLGVAIMLMAFRFQWLDGADARIYDLGMDLRLAPEAPEVVLVAIDEQSLAECFEPSPYPVSRHLKQHARVIQNLSDAGAALIVMDILFDELAGSDSADIATMAASMTVADNVVLASAIENRQQSDRQGTIVSSEHLAMPQELLIKAARGVGLVNMPVGSDGCIRRTYISKSFQKRRLPSLASEVVRCFSGSDTIFSNQGLYTCAIDYAWYRSPLPTISYADALANRSLREVVEGRIVMVGVTESSSPDRYTTPLQEINPVGSDQRLSGAEIQALAAQTLLGPSCLTTLDDFWQRLGGALLVLAFCTVLLRARPTFAFVMALLMAAVLATLALVAVALWSIIIPVAAVILALTGSTFIMLGLNYTSVRLVSEEQSSTLKDIRDDLSSASQLQENLQPREFPEHPKLDIYAFQIPCKEVGGDYYDVIELADNRLGVMVADVSGKGVTGSLIMANMQGRFRKIARETTSPSRVFAELNDLVSEITKSPGKFVTAFYGILDIDSLELTYANAAHNYPIICSAEGQTRLLEESGPMLGPFPDLVWEDHTMALSPGESLCIFTDGVTEAGGDEPSLQFGESRVRQTLHKSCCCTAKEVALGLLSVCKEHVAELGFDDDVTIAVVKIRDTH